MHMDAHTKGSHLLWWISGVINLGSPPPTLAIFFRVLYLKKVICYPLIENEKTKKLKTKDRKERDCKLNRGCGCGWQAFGWYCNFTTAQDSHWSSFTIPKLETLKKKSTLCLKVWTSTHTDFLELKVFFYIVIKMLLKKNGYNFAMNCRTLKTVRRTRGEKVVSVHVDATSSTVIWI